jgi:two-component system, cell cycle sensor histidine kinase and response regulator CckA
MWGPLRQVASRERLWRVLAVMILLVTYELLFMRVHAEVGTAAFLLALVPCFVSGLTLGARFAFLTVVITIFLDRRHGIALGLPMGPQLVAAVLAKLLIGVGTGVIFDHQRRISQLNRALSRETTERLQTQAHLLESERLQRELVSNLGEGVGLFDAAGHLVFANPMFFRTLQVEPDELLEQKFSEWVKAPPVLAYPRSYEVILPERGERSERLLVVTETRLARSSPSNDCTVCVIRDLTERVATERRQRKLELELERNQALQGLAVLAGGVAHDFNNLLGGVVGNAELALRKLPPNTSPKVQECLSEIKGFAKEAAALSRQMLAYAGRRSLAIAELDINHEIEEALRLVRTTVAARAHLQLQLAPDLPRVHADRTQFKQVMTNLLINAAEALDGTRGNVTITTRSQYMKLTDLARLNAPEGITAGDYVEVAVEDTGVGVTADLQERIFQPYFSTKSQSRGMGLAAAWGIARTHRGWISVDSSPGVGSRFVFWLPAGAHVSESLPAPAPRSGVSTPRRDCVLLIDDEPAVRLVTRKLLTELGRRVVTAECGQRGIDLFVKCQRDIDLVLLDLTMPDLSGAEVLSRLRNIEPNVHVIITSGFQPTDAQYLTSEPNVLGFLEKPHTLANLEAVLGLGAAIQQSATSSN